MTAILPVSGPFGQLASASFLFVALFSDVLLIRLFLTFAYVFLLLGATTGHPGWKDFDLNNSVAVDGIIWASICLLLHGFALCRLVYDERPIKFKTPDEEQLWRFFYRRSGMKRLEMLQVLKYGRWVRVEAGQPILGPKDSKVRLCLLVEGLASFKTVFHGRGDVKKQLHSGAVFDLALLNIFGVYIGLERGQHKSFHATADTDCLLYTWGAEELSIMATKLSPAVAAFWRNFTLCTVGMTLDYQGHQGTNMVCATGEDESPLVLQGGRSRDFTDPLRSYEQQRHSVRSVLTWIWRSLSPFLPPGSRHNALPANGILARNRVVAMKAATAWAALSREDASAGSTRSRGDGAELASGVSEDGGAAAHRLLQQLESMGQIRNANMEELARDFSGHGGSAYAAAAAVAAAMRETDLQGGTGRGGFFDVSLSLGLSSGALEAELKPHSPSGSPPPQDNSTVVLPGGSSPPHCVHIVDGPAKQGSGDSVE